jgi:RHS repeat-associated protein
LAYIYGRDSYGFGYDSRGNIRSNQRNTFVYNVAGQMKSAGGNSYVYDGHNRRVKKTDAFGTSYSMYSFGGKLLFRKINGADKDYYYLGQKLVATKKSSTVEYVHTDFLGSPAAYSDTNGVVTERLHYEPFGETIESDKQKDDTGYTGHQHDKDIGLTYMQARYYDPVIGRFYSNDPVGYTPKNPVMSFNRYLYVNNNPYKYTDPNGEFLNVLIGATVGALAEVASQALAGKGFNGSTIVASAAMGGITSGYSVVAAAGKTLSNGSKLFNGSLQAAGSASESIIHDGLDGNNADFGKALKSAVGTVPGVGNSGTMTKIMGDKVKDSMTSKGYVEGVAELTDSAAKAAVGTTVKELEKRATDEN